MRRRHPPLLGALLAASLLGLGLAACASGANQGAAVTPSAHGQPSAPPEVTPAQSAAATPRSPTPSPSDAAHVAAGLALVVLPDDDSPTGQVFVVDADGSMRQLTGDGPASASGASLPAWSPAKDRVAFGPSKVGAGTERFLSVINADGTEERPLAALADEFGPPFGWSPDGTSVVYYDIDAVHGPAMWLADVTTGEVRHLGAGQVPRWLPDGQAISYLGAVAGRDPADPLALTQVIYLMDLSDGATTEFAEAADAVWSPDGSAVVLQLAAGELVLADADGSNPRTLGGGWSPVWSPDGQQIVIGYAHDADGVPLLALIDREGRTIWSGLPGASPTWSPDGSRLAVEVAFPHPMVSVADGATGDVIWQAAGAQPAWSR